MFGDLDRPLNALRGFVSISWASRLRQSDLNDLSRTVDERRSNGSLILVVTTALFLSVSQCKRPWRVFSSTPRSRQREELHKGMRQGGQHGAASRRAERQHWGN